MSIDFNKPVKTDNYDTGMLASIRAHIVAAACQLDPAEASVGTVSNPPTGARRLASGGVWERYSGSAWVEMATAYLKATTAAATYAPLGGSGASGTWAISITGSAPWSGITGKPALVSETADTAATASTLVKRNGAGEVYAAYFNQASGLEAVTVGAVFVQSSAGDGWLRKISLANFNAAISPAWGNVTGKPTTLAGYGISDGITAAAAASTYAALSSGPVFSGQVRGNGGSKGLGAITVTTTTGTPSGGSDGDLVLVY